MTGDSHLSSTAGDSRRQPNIFQKISRDEKEAFPGIPQEDFPGAPSQSSSLRRSRGPREQRKRIEKPLLPPAVPDQSGSGTDDDKTEATVSVYLIATLTLYAGQMFWLGAWELIDVDMVTVGHIPWGIPRDIGITMGGVLGLMLLDRFYEEGGGMGHMWWDGDKLFGRWKPPGRYLVCPRSAFAAAGEKMPISAAVHPAATAVAEVTVAAVAV